MTYKNKKNLYKILFIIILLGFIISLAGCGWFSLGLWNIFDPQAQLRVKNFGYDANNKCKNSVTFELFSINQVEFIGTGFELEYYRGNTKLFSSTIGLNYYVAPSSAPGEAGTSTKISELFLYSQDVVDYVKTYSAFNEVTCDLYAIGKDSAGHNLELKIVSNIPALGVVNEPPEANINLEPSTGECPLTVIFDGSGSKPYNNCLGIAKYEWYIPQLSSGIISTDPVFSEVLPCSLIPSTDSEEVVTVSLTVTDYFGNQDTDVKPIIIQKSEGDTGEDGGCS